MTIHTLRTIHDLLTETEFKAETLLKWAREARNAAEDEGDEAKLARKQEEYEAAYRKHDDAYRALQDFECHEFR